MRVEILGTGCAKCNRLYETAREAVAAAGLDAEVVKVEDITEIMSRGVMVTPALVVDGEVKVVGRVPKPAEIAGLLGA